MDCDLKVTYPGDVINGIFGGDDMVFWGFSAGTGGFSNEQKVRNIRSNLLVIDDQFICSGNTSVPITIPATASNFSWNTTVGVDDPTSLTPTFSPTVTTEYVISYQGFCGSTIEDTFTVFVGGAASATLGADTAVCGAVNITLDAQNPGADYLWDNGDLTQTRSVNSAGTYWVEVTNTGGCSIRDSIVITSAADLVVDLGEDTTICPGQSLTLDAGHPGATHSWNVGGSDQTKLVSNAGNYIVTVNSGGCSGTDTIDVVLGLPVSVDLGEDTTLCPNQSMTLDAGNIGLTHLWNTAESTDQISIDFGGTYEVLVTNAQGCTDRDTIVILSASAVVVDLGLDTSLCSGQTLTLDAGNAGASYLWSNATNGQTLIASPGNVYWVEVSSSVGCMDRDTISLGTGIIVNLGQDTALCEGQNLVLDAQHTGSVFNWNTGGAAQTITIDTSGS